MNRRASTLNKHSKQILFAEDDRLLRLLYRQFMGKFLPGCNIHTAANGSIAWRILKRSHFDVVVTDLNMPDICGRELYLLVRKKYSSIQNCEMPGFIFCSGVLPALKTISAAFAQDKCLFMEKPFHLPKLAKAIASLLSGPGIALLPGL